MENYFSEKRTYAPNNNRAESANRIYHNFFNTSILSIYFKGNFITESSTPLDIFSYIGTNATIIAFIVAAGEVVHSIRITKAIQVEANQLLKNVKNIENASSFSDCVSSIDAVSKAVFEEKYEIAITHFQSFRKICVKVVPGFTVNKKDKKELNVLSDVEYFLLKATKTTTKSPLSNQQKDVLLKNILLIKQEIESLNPAKGHKDVTSEN